jgi:hypothetical protein
MSAGTARRRQSWLSSWFSLHTFLPDLFLFITSVPAWYLSSIFKSSFFISVHITSSHFNLISTASKAHISARRPYILRTFVFFPSSSPQISQIRPRPLRITIIPVMSFQSPCRLMLLNELLTTSLNNTQMHFLLLFPLLLLTL